MIATMRGSKLNIPHSYTACSPFSLIILFISSLAFSTNSSILAGWIRPSKIRFSSARRAICLLIGSNEEMIIEPGVSSTISSTPETRSKALIFRPSFPITLPFISLFGIFTMVVISSEAVLEARR